VAYLVDSDWLIDYIAESPEAVELLERLAPVGVAFSIVSYMESYQGVARTTGPEEARRRLELILENIPVIPFSLSAARRCAELREQLRQHGKRVNQRALDLIIAATAIEFDLTLVTRNLDDFNDVPELKLYSAT
jgi:predicted nucleic acid-binding protein